MKKILVTAILSCTAFIANAQHRHYHHYHHHHGHNQVIPALIIGGLFGAAIAQSYENQRQPTIIVQQPPLATAYDTVIIDGYMYTRQVMLVNGIYREVLVRR